MNVFHFLLQEIHRVNIFCLDILPNTVLMSFITLLLLKKIQHFVLTIYSQFLHDFVSCKRAKLLNYFPNCVAFRF